MEPSNKVYTDAATEKVLRVEDYAGFGKGPHFVNLIKPYENPPFLLNLTRAHAREDINWPAIRSVERLQKRFFPFVWQTVYRYFTVQQLLI